MNCVKDRLWFTSDLHFFHNNIIKYCNRPFKNSDEMNVELINRWNKKVNKGHDVFIIGDIAMGNSSYSDRLAKILNALNGNKYLIPGNHDSYILDSQKCLENIIVLPPIFEIKVQDPDAHKGSQGIVMCHYAMKVWNRSHRGYWNLYGHSHHNMPEDFSIKALDVGVDGKGYDYAPISYEFIKERMKSHKQEKLDHHGDI